MEHDSQTQNCRLSIEVPDDATLQRISKILSSGPPSPSRLDAVLKVFPALTVIGGAIWALILFFSHDRRLREQELMLNQAKIDFDLLELRTKTQVIGAVSAAMRVARDADDGSYSARFTLSVPNAAKTAIQVNATHIELFLGTSTMPPGGALAPTDGKVFFVDAPLGMDDHPAGQGAQIALPGPSPLVNWQLKTTEQYLISSNKGATGPLRPGEESVADLHYSIHAAPGQWLAVRARVQIQPSLEAKTSEGTRVYTVTRFCQLDGNAVFGCSQT